MLYSANISVVNYVDYFVGVSKSKSSYFDYQYMLDLLNNLGLDVNFVKCVKPSTEMVFWGKLYNTESMTVCIPEEKIKETIDLLHWFEYRKCFSKRQLQ
jgi:LEA14-like dessication related protein